VRTRIFIALLISVQTAKAVSPDIPKHYEYRAVVFENLADEILNSAAKQNVTLYKNQILVTIQNNLNTVFDEVLLKSENFVSCASTNKECIAQQFQKLNASYPQKIENAYFNFYNYQKYIWTKIYIAPKEGWDELNEWYPQFIKLNFDLDYDTLIGSNTNNLFLNSRVMFYRLKEDLYPEQVHISKSLFTAYYNHCVYLLKSSSIIAYEYINKTNEVDSIMNIAADIKSVYTETAPDIANVYIAAAFNDHFPIGISGEELLNIFYASNYLLEKALKHHETGKVHYALGALYNNFLVDYSALYSTPEKLALFGKSIVPTELMEKSIEHLEQACALDEDYCNLRKFRDKR
jgi:hypothetical protein